MSSFYVEPPLIRKKYDLKGYYVEVDGNITHGFHEDLDVIIKEYQAKGYMLIDESANLLMPKPEFFKRKKRK